MQIEHFTSQDGRVVERFKALRSGRSPVLFSFPTSDRLVVVTYVYFITDV